VSKGKRKVSTKSRKAKAPKVRKTPVVRKPKRSARRSPAPAAPAAPPAQRGPPAGLARALAMASADVGDVQVKSKSGPTETLPSHAPHDEPAKRPPPPAAASPVPTPRGSQVVIPDDDGDDDRPMVVKGGPAKVQASLGDGVQVASKGPAKFSLEDMEALRKAIVIKGSGRIVAGINLDELKYDQEGLVAVVTQDRVTGAVLMQAWANKEALEKSLTTNEMTYFSRQRNKLWTKGEESGNTQKLLHVKVDCDKDAVLAVVEQTGVACHRETGTCFSDGRDIPVAGFLGELDALIAERAKERPDGSYTTKLLEDPSLAAGKVVEEAKEVAQVLKGKPNKDTLQHEAADLVFHLMVACRIKGVTLRDIVAELAARHTKDPKKV
jgi:phosphoribosyl-AMP cyclohydrolase / phosphoribosyl-ATP pyrophosphohydrolase